MKKMLFIVSLVLIVVLSACSDDTSIYNFKPRKDDILVSTNGTILVEYKTNEDGKLIKLHIDRLLSIEDMIYFNPLVDYDYELEGFTGDIYTIAGYSCTKYDNFKVPINIEIGSTRFKYNRIDCEYQQVDRNNLVNNGYYDVSYRLKDTIGVDQDTVISIVVYDENSLEKFINIVDLPNSVKTIGVYSIGFNSDLDDFTSDLDNYYKEIAIYEQLFLKLQGNDLTISEVSGFTEDINLLDIGNLGEITPLIADFVIAYEDEIKAMDELEDLIRIVNEEAVEGDDLSETPEDE